MTDRGYEKGYADGHAAGMDSTEEMYAGREPGAHNAGNLTREDIKAMDASSINANWDEVQRVLKGEQ